MRSKSPRLALVVVLCALVIFPAQAASSSEAPYDVDFPLSTKISPGQQREVQISVHRSGSAGEGSVLVAAEVDGGLVVTPSETTATLSGDGAARVTLNLTAPVDVTVPYRALLVVTVAGKPYYIDVRLDLATRHGAASASSTQAGFSPSGANNGNRDSSSWSLTGPYDNGWNDNTPGAFPDWLRIDFAGPAPVGRVDLYTLDSVMFPAALWGIRDADIELLVDGTWESVGQVSSNVFEGMWTWSFEPVKATAIRVTVRGSNDEVITGGASRIIEVEAYPR